MFRRTTLRGRVILFATTVTATVVIKGDDRLSGDHRCAG
jgi:hypothetical protein